MLITPSSPRILRQMSQRDHTSVFDLATEAGCEWHTAMRAVTRLQAIGAVTVSRGTQGRLHVRLTRRGREIARLLEV